MRVFWLILVFSFFVGCSDPVQSSRIEPSLAGDGQCRRAFSGLTDPVYRCENSEVICYQSDGAEATSIQCRWK